MESRKKIYLKDLFKLFYLVKESEHQIAVFGDLHEFTRHFLCFYRTVGRAIINENGQSEKGTKPFGPKALDAYDKLCAFLVRRGVLNPRPGSG